MITCLIIIVLPRVQVQMFVQRASAQRRAHVEVIQLLAVHVEEVRVPLREFKTDHLVEVEEAGLGGEARHGLYLGELVEVAGGDDACLGVLCEDLCDEVLVLLVYLVMMGVEENVRL